MEKRRGRRGIEVTKMRRGGIKRGENNLASNQFPKCSPQPGTHKEIHRVGQRRGGGGRIQRQSGGEKGESKGGESNHASNLTPKQNWVLKIVFLKVQIDNKYPKGKIRNLEQRLQSQKYNIKKSKTKSQNYEICIYKVFFKKRVFFCEVIVGYKNEN